MSNTDAVIKFNPDGSLSIPNNLLEKFSQNPSDEVLNEVQASGPKTNKFKPKDNSSSNNDSEEKDVAVCEKRKRRKNGPNLNIKPLVPKIPKEGECHFCFTSETSPELGEARTQDGITVHYRCLLFSSGLCQRGNPSEGLWGFLTTDIKKELARGKRLRCSFCKESGGLIGCHKARCPHTYHFQCGIKNGALMQHYDSFRSFCKLHRPLQHYPDNMMGKAVDCPICREQILISEKVVPHEVLITECCNLTPLHRDCIQKQADASGYFFRCPMCNNDKKYNMIMKIMGISIPLSDALWEKDGYYDDLLAEYWHCDIPICLHPEGRTADSRSRDKWDLMRCVSCGQSGAHPACIGFEKRGPKIWSCKLCTEVLMKLEKERKEKGNQGIEDVAGCNDDSVSSTSINTVAGSSSTTAATTATTTTETFNWRKRRVLSPSRDPFLMSPADLKEAVFRLCVYRLKKDKMIDKDINPENCKWTGVERGGVVSEEEEEEEEDAPLRPRKFAIVLSRPRVTPKFSPNNTKENKIQPRCQTRIDGYFKPLYSNENRPTALASRNNIQSNTKKLNRKTVTCSLCKESLPYENLKTHVKEVHGKSMEFRCYQCPLSFASPAECMFHIKRDHTSKPLLKCSLCDMQFSSSNLKTHVQTVHNKVMPFKCYMCREAFDSPQSCMDHIKSCHANKPGKSDNSILPKTEAFTENETEPLQKSGGLKSPNKLLLSSQSGADDDCEKTTEKSEYTIPEEAMDEEKEAKLDVSQNVDESEPEVHMDHRLTSVTDEEEFGERSKVVHDVKENVQEQKSNEVPNVDIYCNIIDKVSIISSQFDKECQETTHKFSSKVVSHIQPTLSTDKPNIQPASTDEPNVQLSSTDFDIKSTYSDFNIQSTSTDFNIQPTSTYKLNIQPSCTDELSIKPISIENLPNIQHTSTSDTPLSTPSAETPIQLASTGESNMQPTLTSDIPLSTPSAEIPIQPTSEVPTSTEISIVKPTSCEVPSIQPTSSDELNVQPTLTTETSLIPLSDEIFNTQLNSSDIHSTSTESPNIQITSTGEPIIQPTSTEISIVQINSSEIACIETTSAEISALQPASTDEQDIQPSSTDGLDIQPISPRNIPNIQPASSLSIPHIIATSTEKPDTPHTSSELSSVQSTPTLISYTQFQKRTEPLREDEHIESQIAESYEKEPANCAIGNDDLYESLISKLENVSFADENMDDMDDIDQLSDSAASSSSSSFRGFSTDESPIDSPRIVHKFKLYPARPTLRKKRLTIELVKLPIGEKDSVATKTLSPIGHNASLEQSLLNDVTPIIQKQPEDLGNSNKEEHDGIDNSTEKLEEDSTAGPKSPTSVLYKVYQKYQSRKTDIEVQMDRPKTWSDLYKQPEGCQSTLVSADSESEKEPDGGENRKTVGERDKSMVINEGKGSKKVKEEYNSKEESGRPSLPPIKYIPDDMGYNYRGKWSDKESLVIIEFFRRNPELWNTRLGKEMPFALSSQISKILQVYDINAIKRQWIFLKNGVEKSLRYNTFFKFKSKLLFLYEQEKEEDNPPEIQPSKNKKRTSTSFSSESNQTESVVRSKEKSRMGNPELASGSSIASNKQEKKSQLESQSGPSTTELTAVEWTPRNVLKVIDFYRENACLWDGTMSKKDLALRWKMLTPLSEALGIDSKSVSAFFSALRNRYFMARTSNNSKNPFVKPLQFLELVYNMTDSDLMQYYNESKKYSLRNTDFLAELETMYDTKSKSWKIPRGRRKQGRSGDHKPVSAVEDGTLSNEQQSDEPANSSATKHKTSQATGKQKFKLSDTEIYMLADFYKNHPLLWKGNLRHAEEEKRDDELLELCELLGVEDTATVEAMWESLRKRYFAARNSRSSSWNYYNELSFLGKNNSVEYSSDEEPASPKKVKKKRGRKPKNFIANQENKKIKRNRTSVESCKPSSEISNTKTATSSPRSDKACSRKSDEKETTDISYQKPVIVQPESSESLETNAIHTTITVTQENCNVGEETTSSNADAVAINIRLDNAQAREERCPSADDESLTEDGTEDSSCEEEFEDLSSNEKAIPTSFSGRQEDVTMHDVR